MISFRKTAGILSGLAFAGFTAHSAAAETKTYVVNWFTMASFNQDGDCIDGINPDMDHQYRLDLAQVGYSKEQIEELMGQLNENQTPGQKRDVYEAISQRGRIDGKHVDAYTNPASVADPHLHQIGGKMAYGFNLDGKGAASPIGFEDPETHEKGVNNQAFRALGCSPGYRGTANIRPVQWSWNWDSLRSGMPAWLMTVTADDFTKDGDVTVTFDRAREHITRDSNGGVQQDMTYRIDPDQRSHNVLHLKMKDGVMTLPDHPSFHMMGDVLLFPVFRINNTHLRLKFTPEGNLDGIMGGYQPWLDIYFCIAAGAQGAENNLGLDMPGAWHAMHRLADAEPDPKTGSNTAISVAYRIETVPAFILPPALSAKDKTASAQ